MPNNFRDSTLKRFPTPNYYQATIKRYKEIVKANIL